MIEFHSIPIHSMFYPMPGRAGQGSVKVGIGCGLGGVAWRGVGFGRVGKCRVGLGLGVGEGVYMGLGKVGSVGLGGMWVWVGGVGLLPPPNPNIPYPTQPHLHYYLPPPFTPTLSTSTLPFLLGYVRLG